MQCILGEYGKEINTAKEVNISIEFKEYDDVLFNKKLTRHKVNRIQSKLQKIATYDVCKISFSCFDDKRYILNDENTLKYFHVKGFYLLVRQ